MSTIKTNIAAWLSVSNSKKAVAFYKAAFGAIETYRLEDPDGNAVVKLSVDGAEFWLSDATPGDTAKEKVGGGSLRLLLTVENPDVIFSKALQAGATEVFAVGEEHGWRLGRITDPFGLDWEIGKPI